MNTDLRIWRDQAQACVTEALYARHPDLEQRFGTRGRQVCRDDIGHHLDYLQAALDLGEPAPFLCYAAWLSDLLQHRGVAPAHLTESFALLEEFFSRHLPPAQAATVCAILRAACSPSVALVPYGHSRLPTLAQAPDYHAAILRGDQHGAFSLMRQAMHEGGYGHAAVAMVQPALYEIGRLWQENRVSVAQEHLATAVSQTVLAQAYVEAQFAPPNGRRVVLACVPGNQHSLGLRMLADVFETAGWESLYLGADVPVGDLIRLLDAQAPQLLALSLSLPMQIVITREAIARIRADLGSRCPEIWVGGLATQGVERIWQTVRAHGWAADALHALEQIK